MTGAEDDTGRVRYFQLQTLARRQGRDTQELLTLYALEGLLARLAASDHSHTLVLKGGMLLAAFGQRRPTRDLDVQARQLPNDLGAVRRLIVEIAGIDLDDGLLLDTASATAPSRSATSTSTAGSASRPARGSTPERLRSVVGE